MHQEAGILRAGPMAPFYIEDGGAACQGWGAEFPVSDRA